jgi:hypothetical protein
LPWALTVCQYHRDCPLYRRDSYTCNEDLSKDWCGAYKDRKYGPVIRVKESVEGLLKKRIREIIEKSSGYLAPECKVCLEEFYSKILDEAKKDLSPAIRIDVPTGLSKDQEQFFADGFQQAHDRWCERVKKWFGGVEK